MFPVSIKSLVSFDLNLSGADEILVNAADNFQRDKSMDCIKIDIDRTKGMISVWNNGSGVPIEIHKEHNVYVPEMIFGKSETKTQNLLRLTFDFEQLR
jgi:DNA gyrase/topoisomerase IV subunit B